VNAWRYLLFIWNIDINFTPEDMKVIGEREVGRALSENGTEAWAISFT
jgi:hypothetical protein